MRAGAVISLRRPSAAGVYPAAARRGRNGSARLMRWMSYLAARDSPTLDSPCQCEVYRLVERQSTPFLPGAAEGSVISGRDTGRGHAPVIAGPFIWRHRRTGLRSRSLCGTPDAGGAQRVEPRSDHRGQSLQRSRNAELIPQFPTDRQTLLEQRPGGRIVALVEGRVPQGVQRVGAPERIPQFPTHPETLLAQRPGRRIVALLP